VKLCYASPYLPWVQNNQYHPFYHCSFHTWLLFCIKSCWLNHDYPYFVSDLGKSFTQGVCCFDVFWLGGLITWTIISGIDMWLLSSIILAPQSLDPPFGAVWQTMWSLPRLCRPSVSVWKHLCFQPHYVTLTSITPILFPTLSRSWKLYFVDHCKNSWLIDWLLDWRFNS